MQAMSDGTHSQSVIYRISESNNRVVSLIFLVLVVYFLLLAGGVIPSAHVDLDSHSAVIPETSPEVESPVSEQDPPEVFVPHTWAVLPFVLLLLSIALLPLIRFTERWWHSNRNRFLLAITLGILTLFYYGLAHPGGIANHFTHVEHSEPGWETVFAAFSNAIFSEFVPFIVLLFSLYVISGGINLRGDLPARPLVNCSFLGIGSLIASFIGTTGAAMVLIRPLISTNAERKYRVHTIIFFTFLVCNCGGLLLPIGDPPLFLGYLRGVPFLWTLGLWPYWLAVNSLLLVIYYAWDRFLYSREEIRDIVRDETEIRRLQFSGKINFALILGVVLCVAFVVPGQPFLGTHFEPPNFLREALMLLLVALSLKLTRPEVRHWNRFDYHAIVEVAALFSGIFLCMQVPIEILNVRGASLGIDTPFSFFWATGVLSSFLDNAPTYVVFFEAAVGLTSAGTEAVVQLGGGRAIYEIYLIAISLGAVFMGANTYIGNGPNFMVKSIAEQAGIRMPSFFGYMVYSLLVLIPVFLIVGVFL